MKRDEYHGVSTALVVATQSLLEAVEGFSADEAEAAENAAKAFEALCAHRLLRGVSQADELDPMAEVLHDGLDDRYVCWQSILVHNVARLSGCWTRRQSRRGGREDTYVVGRKVDCEILVYVTSYLVREIRRLAAERYGADAHQVESFARGATATVLEVIRAERWRWDREHPTMAEVEVSERGSLNEYWKRNHHALPSERTVSDKGLDPLAYAEGRRAGTHILSEPAARGALRGQYSVTKT
jgi:hypothetical protein